MKRHRRCRMQRTSAEMNAQEVYDQLQPLGLIVDEQVSSEARVLLDALDAIRQRRRWSDLDASAAAVEGLGHHRADYPVLLLHLADCFLQAGRLPKADDCVSAAQAILQSERAPGDQQNKAVATLYEGLLQHRLERLADAVPAYDQSRCQFRQSIGEWQHTSPGSSRIEDCRLADAQLHTCVKAVLLSRLGTKSVGQPSAAEWKRAEPIAPKPRRPFSRAKTAPYRDVGALGVAVAALLAVILGIAAYSLGGWKGLLAFVAAWFGTLFAGLFTLRAVSGGRFRLRVPYEHVAVVEERGTIHIIGPGEKWLLMPWVSKERATVPLLELTYTLRKHRVPLGGSQACESAGHLRLTTQVGYQVYDAERATLLFEKRLGGKDDPRSPADLEAVWESQLASDLKPLLVDEVWGRPAGECLVHRVTIQDNLKHRLAGKTQAWGVNITGLTILEMEVQ